jgi:hypothetical protein
MVGLRAIAGLLATVLVAITAYAEPTPKDQTSASTTKAAKSAKSTSAQPARSIDIKRDAKEGWSEMKRSGHAIKSGVPAAGRAARDTAKFHWNRAKEGFTGSPPPSVAKPAE